VCEFVSWIEKDGTVLYLTDTDVYSSFGRSKLRGMRDNDVLGHGAIRQFYDVSDAGVSKERVRFWGRDVPKEIRDAIKSGAMTRMLKDSLGAFDIVNIVASKPPAWVLEALGRTGRLKTTRRKTGVFCDVLDWWDDSQLHRRYRFKNGQRHGLSECWYPDGRTQWARQYHCGYQVSAKTWHLDGKLASRAAFKRGRRHGVDEAWWSNGERRWCHNWKNGKLHGTSRQWNRQGELKAQEFYVNGEERTCVNS
jgi:hypothetical protein